MLTKRTNILFEEDMWMQLSSLAKTKKTSVGDLVREAVKMQYFVSLKEEEKQKKRLKALETMREIRSRMNRHGLSHEELKQYKEDGRKY